MIVSELIQQQRHILYTLHSIVEQYRQQIAYAQKRLEHRLEQIKADRVATEQEAKQEYEQARDRYIRAVLNHYLPKITGKEQATREREREELRDRLLSTMPSQTAINIGDIGSLKSEMVKLAASDLNAVSAKRTKISTTKAIFLLISLFVCLPLVVIVASAVEGFESFMICLGGLFVLVLASTLFIYFSEVKGYKLMQGEMVLVKSNLSHLAGLYHRYLELAAQQAQMQKAEAQRVYQQSLEQIKQQFLNSVQQLPSTMLDYSTLSNQASPPWQSETWQNWRPGTLTPGVVRLGVFTLQIDQLEAKPVKIGEIVGIADAKLVSNSGGTR